MCRYFKENVTNSYSSSKHPLLTNFFQSYTIYLIYFDSSFWIKLFFSLGYSKYLSFLAICSNSKLSFITFVRYSLYHFVLINITLKILTIKMKQTSIISNYFHLKQSFHHSAIYSSFILNASFSEKICHYLHLHSTYDLLSIVFSAINTHLLNLNFFILLDSPPFYYL